MRSTFVALVFASAALARPARLDRRVDAKANGEAAIALNAKFATLTANSPCTEGEDACVTGQVAQCVNGKFVLQPCAATTQCFALPLVNSAGTSITCDTQADFDARIAATGASAGAAAPPPPSASTAAAPPPPATSTAAAPPPPATTTAAAPPAVTSATDNSAAGGIQASLILDPSVVCTNCTQNGQNPPVAGQTASDTSPNNFINFCAATISNLPITNGQQVTTGSCNPIPMGQIPAKDKMPSAKFVFPPNQGTVTANQAFNVQLALKNIQTGVFTNAAFTYFMAPQKLNAQGQIIGHTHVVIEALSALGQTTPTDPTKFVFFKGIDAPADANGIATAAVTAGVPAGSYRICSINTSANHVPAIVPIAQHGMLDDCAYFTSA
ncbi:unnamed protein product [Mycena citricolor]|uniref:Carbohydrate-binding module family 19 domain-containing protein n=1 Tax=Mycena citricolor TaxID=2018698 RepID=A0AAD2Q1V2_9AGAR|nr:unnamed protein product [Mycena citricolor]